MKKRLLSVLLALCMVLTMLPVSAIAADEAAPSAPSAEEEITVREETPEDALDLEEDPEETEEPEETPEDALDLEEDPEEPEIPEEEPEVTEDTPEEPEELQGESEEETSASGTCGENLIWTLNNQGVLYISGNGDMTSYVSAANVPWINYVDQINTAIIESNVTSIGSFAFCSCSNLKSITISESVDQIGKYAFYQCTSLTSVEVPPSVTVIEMSTFSGCTSLASVTLPDNLISIGQYAFNSCCLTSITLSENISTIESKAFVNCDSLIIQYESTKDNWESISDSSTVTNKVICSDGSLWGYGTCGNDTMWELSGEYTLAISGSGNMDDFSSSYYVPWKSKRNLIKNIEIDSGITSIGDYAFYYLTEVSAISLPDSIVSIGEYAFYSCNKLATVNGCEKLVTIEKSAFYNCISLISITLPTCLESIGDNAFRNCDNVTIHYNGTKTAWKSVIGASNVLQNVECSDATLMGFGTCGENLKWEVDGDKTLTISGSGVIPNYVDGYGIPWSDFQSAITSIKIENGITVIGECAFYNCQVLTNIIIPNTVTEIGEGAFAYCEKLSAISLPDALVSIGNYAFRDCDSLVSLSIPDNVASVGKYAFYDCDQLESVAIGTGLKSIGESAFDYCNKLTISYALLRSDWEQIDGYTNVDADVICADDMTWDLSADGVLTISGVKNMPNYEVGCAPWYNSRNVITSIVISNGLTSIGSNAFYDCYNVTSISIPSSVQTVEEGAFSHCTSLTDVVIPEGIDEIRYNTFYYCTSLSNIELPESLVAIDEQAFYNCTLLTNLSVPAGVTYFGKNAFSGCDSLGSLTIPAVCTAIGDYAFADSGLTSISFPDSIEAIGDYAFYNCDNLSKIVIPSECAVIGNYAFAYSELINITFLGNTNISGNYAFYNCDKLLRIDIPAGTSSIGNYAFYDCNRLTAVTMADTVTSIGDYAFYDCCYLDSLTLSSGLTEIGSHAFYYCTGIQSLALPNSITSIGTYAFAQSGLQNIELPYNLTTIEDYAFYDSYLSKATIADSVTTIGKFAFAECNNLYQIYIPKSVSSIDDYAFYWCNNLIIFYESASNVWNNIKGASAISQDVFYTISRERYDQMNHFGTCGNNLLWTLESTGTLIISGTGSMTDYSDYYYVPWDNYTVSINKVVVTSGVTSIGDYAFYGCTEMSAVSLPTTITRIGESAFRECTALQSITLPSKISAIPNYCFASSGLKQMTIGTTISSLGESSFYDCENLTQITLPDTITEISSDAFSCCYALSNVHIGLKVTTIDNYAFYRCESLTNVSIPSTVKTIGAHAFAYCDSLNSVTLPAGLTSIGYDAFEDSSEPYYPLTCSDWEKVQGYSDVSVYYNFNLVSITMPYTSTSYTGSQIRPTIIVKDGKNTLSGGTEYYNDYTVSYSNNVNVGTATVKIVGKGDYKGTIVRTFKIVNKQMAGLTVNAIANQTYTGAAITPLVTVKNGSKTLILNTDYSIVYANNLNPGIATITVTGKGNYIGTLTKTFAIAPKASTISALTNTATGIKVNWSKVANASGYYVYRGTALVATITSPSTLTYTDTRAKTSGTKYTYKVIAYKKTSNGTIIKSASSGAKSWYFIKMPVISSVESTAAGKATIKWGAVTGKSGYEIQYSTSANFTSAKTLSSTSGTSKIISSLKRGKKYYFRIRAYKKLGTVKEYSVWSATRSVTVRK